RTTAHSSSGCSPGVWSARPTTTRSHAATERSSEEQSMSVPEDTAAPATGVTDVTLKVNGVQHRVEVEPRRLLSDALRHDVGLTGTHVGCEHGVCGACTVLVDGKPMRSCLMFAIAAQDHEITT